MKKRVVFCFTLSAFIMLVCPWLAVTCVKGDAGMAVCFLLFYVVNPIYSVVAGAVAGKDIRGLYILPFLPTILYLVGIWLFFDLGEPAFVRYAVIYFMLSILAMAKSLLMERKKRR